MDDPSLPDSTSVDAASGPSPSSSEAAPSNPPSIEGLQERLAHGDETAFEHLFRQLSEPVFRFICGMVNDEALAHDLTQDTFAKLWSIRDRLNTIGSLRAYVFQMARHRVYNQQRSEEVRRDNQAEMKRLHPDASPPSPDHTLDARLLQDLLDEWVAELPKRQREALLLRRQNNLSHDEIAAVMDISPKTVNNHLVRAMKRLRRRLHDHRPDLRSS